LKATAVLVWNLERQSIKFPIRDFKQQRLSPSLAINNNLVPRVCLSAGYVVAWLWGNRIEIVIWLAVAIINVADTLMRVFCESTRKHTRRENYQCLSDLECEIKQYKSKDIILLIVWTSIGTLGIYLKNGIVFMNDFLSIYSMSILTYLYVMSLIWKRRRTSFVFIPW
jgi:hypothetical protein